jgi:GTP-binding protein
LGFKKAVFFSLPFLLGFLLTMDFIDEVTFWVRGGRGGDGCVSFRREKFVPKGGPDGGNGGDGGHVILQVNSNLSTLADLRHRKHYRAGHGKNGKGKCMYGKKGKSIVIAVPKGTLVFDKGKGVCVADLVQSKQEIIVAKGGKGGRGNVKFASATHQTPDCAEKGQVGEEREIQLELKLLADIGLVGFPNAGKSTLLSKISAAKPKIADYPFTTLVPNLGIVYYNTYHSFVVADIPGLIEGAHAGKGLGDQFLRHIERTRLLVFLIEITVENPLTVYKALLHELKLFNDSLLDKPRLIAFTKVDLIDDQNKSETSKSLKDKICIPISAITGEGIDLLLKQIIHDLEAFNHEV